MDRWTNGWNEWMDWRLNGWTEGRMNGWTDHEGCTLYICMNG